LHTLEDAEEGGEAGGHGGDAVEVLLDGGVQREAPRAGRR